MNGTHPNYPPNAADDLPHLTCGGQDEKRQPEVIAVTHSTRGRKMMEQPLLNQGGASDIRLHLSLADGKPGVVSDTLRHFIAR
jgi:hypothetical protein